MGARRFRAAVVLSAGALLLTACAEPAPVADDVAAPGGTWAELPSAPLSPRLGAVTAWTGAEALFLGGDVAALCPPDAGCTSLPESATDGAALDPVTQTWRTLADAPHPIAAGTPSTVHGDTVHLVQGDRLVSYDASEDAWSVSPAAPLGEVTGDPAVLDDGTVVVVDDERGRVYDPATRTWSDLPDDQPGPGSGDRSAPPDAPPTDSGGWPAEALGGPLAAVDGWVHDDREGTWTLLERPDGAPAEPGSAVWAGDDLVVLGGMDTDAGWGAQHLTDRAWIWRADAAGADPSG